MKLWRNGKLAIVFSQFRTYVHGCLHSFYVEVEVIAECIKGTVYLNIIITLQVSVVVVVMYRLV